MRMVQKLRATALATTFALGSMFAAQAQTITLKLAHHVAPQHPMSVFLEKWAEEVAAKTGNKLNIAIYPSQQMGPAPRNHRMVTTGVADIAWLLHGLTPEQFPLTGLADLPFTIDGAETGVRVLNSPELRDKYLAPEHKDMKILWLFTSPAGNLNMGNARIDSMAALQGKRIRFPSRPIRDFITALGATPQATSPAEMLEALQKGTIDGTFIDWGGAGLAFKLGPYVKYTTEMRAYVSTMCVCMSQKSFDNLPADLRKALDETVQGRETEIGKLWAGTESAGKKAMMAEGTEAVVLPADEFAKIKAVGMATTKKYVDELDAKKLPAKAVHDLMLSIAAKPQ